MALASIPISNFMNQIGHSYRLICHQIINLFLLFLYKNKF